MVFKSLQTNDSYPTPSLIYELLDAEFHFDLFDPCPLGNPQNIDGLTMTWPSVTYCNPPYSRLKSTKRHGKGWIQKCHEEALQGKIVVLLIPVRADTSWWHGIILANKYEIRFIQNRLRFSERGAAPFASCVVVMR
jgi:hypothetical protein